MRECQKEFATLVKATLQYLQDEWGDHVRLVLKEPPSIPKRALQPKVEVQTENKPPVTEIKKSEKPLPKPVSVDWKLNPMPLPTEQSSQFSTFYHSIPLSIPIRLVLTDPSHTFFLESVARALTKLIAPATLYSGKLDPLLTHHHVRLVLAPLSYLKKRFPQVELHQFLHIDGPTLLPLADHYDLDLKRTLWNTLKSFQNTHPFS